MDVVGTLSGAMSGSGFLDLGDELETDESLLAPSVTVTGSSSGYFGFIDVTTPP